jgi:hypothetical protein
MGNSCPNSQDIPSHKPITCSLGFGLLAQFGRPSVDDRPNYGPNESKRSMQLLPKASDKLRTPIKDDHL